MLNARSVSASTEESLEARRKRNKSETQGGGGLVATHCGERVGKTNKPHNKEEKTDIPFF
jgi:hypothetical protein